MIHRQKLISLKNNGLLFLYSQAHIDDLYQDKSDKKYENLQFMEQLVEDNFLLCNTEADTIGNSLIKPIEAYEEFKPDGTSFENIIKDAFEIFEEDEEDEIKKIVFPLLNLMKSTQVNSDQIKLNEDPHNIYGRLGFDKKPTSLYSWIHEFGSIIDKFHNDNSIIKDIRRVSKEYLQVQKLKINIEDVNFDEDIAKTPLGISFSQLLNNNLGNQSSSKKTLAYTKYVTAFVTLNFLGLDKEKNKKVKFSNTKHDAEHFYYSTMADWVVSNDVGFVNKSRFLLNLITERYENC